MHFSSSRGCFARKVRLVALSRNRMYCGDTDPRHSWTMLIPAHFLQPLLVSMIFLRTFFEMRCWWNDAFHSYLTQLDRLFDPTGFIPTNQDVLRSRQKTTGINETTFKTNDMYYRYVAMEGSDLQRSKNSSNSFNSSSCARLLESSIWVDKGVNGESGESLISRVMFPPWCKAHYWRSKDEKDSLLRECNSYSFPGSNLIVWSVFSWRSRFKRNARSHHAVRHHIELAMVRQNVDHPFSQQGRYLQGEDFDLLHQASLSRLRWWARPALSFFESALYWMD